MDLGYVSLEIVPWIRSALRLIHFAGIILGIGAATLLDLIIFRFVLIRKIEASQVRIIEFSSYVIATGLMLLWLSGIGFFAYYWLFDPDKIANPKLEAKVIIVYLLTVNSVLVHFVVLPKIKTQIGQRLFEGLSTSYCALLVFIGTVSAISWYVPLVLGIVTQLNKTVPAWVILASYAMLVLCTNILIQIALMIVRSPVVAFMILMVSMAAFLAVVA